MNLKFYPKLFAAGATIFLAARLLAADTNAPAAFSRDELANNFLQLQAQLHATQLALEQNQQTAVDAAQSNAFVLAARLESLEQSVARQHASDADAARRTQQLTLLMAGGFALAGLGILLLMVYFQWRAFTQLAQVSSRQHAALANTEAVHQLAAPGRATVETANAQLLNVVSRLEQRINELESGQKLLPASAPAKPADLLTEGQKQLDANVPLKALECFDKFLAAQPAHAAALVKRAEALEKLDRTDEALADYDRAIAADRTLVIAHLQKGGLLNKLNRHAEALDCFEQALLAQDKKAGAKI
jgi:tetratricopeptide (TPR) repeat protein